MELQELVGEHPVAADAMREMNELFALAEAYGFGAPTPLSHSREVGEGSAS